MIGQRNWIAFWIVRNYVWARYLADLLGWVKPNLHTEADEMVNVQYCILSYLSQRCTYSTIERCCLVYLAPENKFELQFCMSFCVIELMVKWFQQRGWRLPCKPSLCFPLGAAFTCPCQCFATFSINGYCEQASPVPSTTTHMTRRATSARGLKLKVYKKYVSPQACPICPSLKGEIIAGTCHLHR